MAVQGCSASSTLFFSEGKRGRRPYLGPTYTKEDSAQLYSVQCTGPNCPPGRKKNDSWAPGQWKGGSRTIESQGWMICWYTFVNSVPRRQHSRKFDGTCISKSNWIHPQIIFNIIYCLFKVKKTLYLYRMNTFTWPNRMHIFSVSPHNIEFSLKSHKILVKWAMRLTNIS